MHPSDPLGSPLPGATVRPARNPTGVIAALVVTQFVAADAIISIYVMLPTIYREFAGQAGLIPWIVTSYFLVAAMIAAAGGRLADLIGRRTVAVGFLFIAILGALTGAIGTHVWMLVVASVLLATMTTLTPILIGLAREHLGEDKVGLGVGAIAAAGSGGAGLIFLIAGVIVDRFGRTGGYLLTAVAAAAAIGMLLATIPRPQRSATRLSDIDFARGILFGPAVAGMILAVELGAGGGWSTGTAPLLLAASIALAAFWVRDQLRQPRPLLDLRILAHGAVPRTLFVMLILGVAGVQQGQIFSLIFQQNAASGVGFGLSATMSGLLLVPINGTAAIVAPIGGWLARRHGASLVALAGAVLITVAWAICALTFHALIPLVLSAMLSLAGLSLLMPANHLLIVEATPPDMTSGAVGLGFTMFDLGFAVGAQIMLAMLMRSGKQAGPADYQFAFIWLAAASAVMVLALVVGVARGRRI